MKKIANLPKNVFIKQKKFNIKAFFKNLSLKRKKAAELEKIDYAEYLLEKKQFKWDGFLKPIILFGHEIKKIRWFKKTSIHFWRLIVFLLIASVFIWLINYFISNSFVWIGVLKDWQLA